MSSAAQTLHVAPSVDDGLALRHYTVTSGDGTRLQAWTNDVDGPTVLLCNGLGTNPYSWPALLDPECGVRVISWNHRGTGGSERPVDTEHVGIDAFAEDAIAVMDDAGIDACVLMGWSMGVNTMFEVAVRHPERVTGLFAVGGVPGDTFASMLAPIFVPRLIRKPITVNAARAMKLLGKPLTQVASRLPVGPITLPGDDPQRLHAADARPGARTPGDQGVPDHADRLVHAPRPALLAAPPGVAAEHRRADQLPRRQVRRPRLRRTT